MARWLQCTVLDAVNTELRDSTIAVTDAQFSQSGNASDFWTERLDTCNEQIVLTIRWASRCWSTLSPRRYQGDLMECAVYLSLRTAHP